jgi:hypothetical protein
VWFSCGAASAIAGKLAAEKYGGKVELIYCNTAKDEHPDNVLLTFVRIQKIVSDKSEF